MADILSMPAAKCAVARAVKDRDKAAELAARQALAEAVITDHIAKVLRDAPKLRDEQRSRLAELLAPVRRRRT